MAKKILESSLEDLVLMVKTVAKKLEIVPEKIGITGGVILHEPCFSLFQNALKKSFPRCEIFKPELPPVVGAAIRALALGGEKITPSVLENLKNSFKKKLSENEKFLVEVRRSRGHGNGVFAREKISAGTLICEYKGEKIGVPELEIREKIRREKSPREPIFIFQIDDENFIDATNFCENNVARFINHSCRENCEARWNAAAERLEIFATREIVPEEELFLDYGFELSGFFERPCLCGNENCCGFVVAKPLRSALLKKIARHKRAQNRK